MLYLSETAKTPKISAAVSSDPSRPALCAAHLEVEKKQKGRRRGRIIATDSYLLTVVPVEFDTDENPTAGPISLEILKAMEKSKTFTRFDNGNVIVDGVTYERPKDLGKYPKADQLLPPEENLSDFRVGINAAFLKRAADALGAEVVVLEFITAAELTATEPIDPDNPDSRRYRLPTGLRAIRVRPSVRSGAGHSLADGPYGVIMPVKVSS